MSGTAFIGWPRRLVPLVLFVFLTWTAAAAAAATIHEELSGWIDRLDQEAVALQQQAERPITRIGPGPVIRPGAVGERVERLARRLVELGYLAAEQQGSFYEGPLEAAVRAFQADQGLNADGRVGSQTVDALDRTQGDVIAALRQTSDSMLRFLKQAPDDFVLVNLPSQTATLVRDRQVVVSMRAAIGRPSRETPLLEDQITHIIVNPTWTVPPTVLRQDKLPHLRRTGTPGIDYASVYLDGQFVIPETVDWSQVSPNRIRIVQTPGDHNALGRFRFNMTNDRDIYMHGTNDPKVFARGQRAVSSGCVRLEDARTMAENLLADAGVKSAQIDALLAKGTPQWLKLARPMPVRFVYWRATVAPSGKVVLHPDVYGMTEETEPAI